MQPQRVNQTRTKPVVHERSRPASVKSLRSTTPAHPILRLQQTIGNRGVQRLLQSRTIQPKLAISQPGDIYEQEADRIADKVMRMPEPDFKGSQLQSGVMLQPRVTEHELSNSNGSMIQRAEAAGELVAAEEGRPKEPTEEDGSRCPSWFNDPQSLSKRAAETYAQNDMTPPSTATVERTECEGPNWLGNWGCYVHFSDGLVLRVIVRAKDVVVGVPPITTWTPPAATPLCFYDYHCPEGLLVLTLRECKSATPSGPTIVANPLLRSRAIQPKLAISQPGDVYEQEADRVADQVMRMPEPVIQRACAACAAGGVTCPKCEREEESLVQRKTEQSSESSVSVPNDFLRNIGLGQPLDVATRAFFEPRFGHDFSNVRVHSYPAAQESAHAVSASAYTAGNDIVFAAGRYAPRTGEGRRLIAHELTHVVQQSTSDAVRSVQESEQTRPTAAAGPYIARQAAPAYGKACSRDPAKVDPCQLARCSPGQQTTATGDFATGLRYVNASVTALAAAPLSGFTSRAMDWYFGGHDSKTISTVSTRLGCIATSLTSAPNRYGCHPEYDAWGYTCAGGAGLCGHLARNICFTNSHFGCNPRTRAITAIHEAAHLEGMSTGSARTNPDIYEHQNRFLDISPAQAVQNADSYALFAAAIGTDDLPSTILLTVAAGAGWALSPYADRTWHFQGTLGLEWQHPRLRVFHPTIGLGFTMIGEAENRNSGVRASTSMLGSLLPGLRIGQARRPGAGGGPELSLFGGPALSLSDRKLGAVAGVAFGYRWRLLEFSVGAGYAYDPERAEAGLQHAVTVSGTFTMNFNLR